MRPARNGSDTARSDRTPRGGGAILDAGWPFLIAGLATIASVVLISASVDLAHARWARDRSLAIERQRVERLENYRRFVERLEAGDRSLLQTLAATQLGMIPEGKTLLVGVDDTLPASASVFAALEPSPREVPGPRMTGSTLERLATGERSRVWLIAGAALCLLLGLLPSMGGSAKE
ncbi:MAG: hypothetical protein RBS39_10710 [Phycisphaerales bacterium]|nr:hypothetical protein [Phycisphaerales bacterium]